MDISRLIQQIGMRLLRRFMTKGITKGMGSLSSGGKNRSTSGRQDAGQTAQRMKQLQRLMRGFRR